MGRGVVGFKEARSIEELSAAAIVWQMANTEKCNEAIGKHFKCIHAQSHSILRLRLNGGTTRILDCQEPKPSSDLEALCSMRQER